MRAVLPLVSKSEEDASLHACTAGERACISAACLGSLLPGGFQLPRFRHWDHCVLCLRGQVFAHWLSPESKREIIQPYRNIQGEYAESVLLRRGDIFDGISDPFVRYSPGFFLWEGFTLRQVNVEFRLIPSLHHPALPPQGDIFEALMLSGLLGPRVRTREPSLALTVQQVLWQKNANPASTWIQSILPLTPLEYLAQYIQSNPPLREHVALMQPGWPQVRPKEYRPRKKRLPPEVIPLPAHWLPELGAGQTEQFFCPECFDYKGVLGDQVKKKKGGSGSKGEFKRNRLTGGARCSMSLEGGELRCYHKGKKECHLPLERWDIECCALRIKGRVYFPCKKCGLLLPRGAPCCLEKQEKKCALCHRCKKLREFQVFVDSGLRGTHSLWLCKRHRPPPSPFKIWSEHHLLEEALRHASK